MTLDCNCRSNLNFACILSISEGEEKRGPVMRASHKMEAANVNQPLPNVQLIQHFASPQPHRSPFCHYKPIWATLHAKDPVRIQWEEVVWKTPDSSCNNRAQLNTVPLHGRNFGTSAT